jgi:hypothetical protein
MMTQCELYQNKINKKINVIIELVEGLSAEVIHWKQENGWSIMQILCNVEKSISYWIDELFKVVRGVAIEWGVTFHDEETSAHIVNKNLLCSDPTEGIRRAENIVERRLSSISDRDLNVTALNRDPEVGTKSMIFLIDHFILAHLEKKIDQIQLNIQKYEESKKFLGSIKE